MSLFETMKTQSQLDDFVKEYIENKEKLRETFDTHRQGEKMLDESIERFHKPVTKLQIEGNDKLNDVNLKLVDVKDEVKQGNKHLVEGNKQNVENSKKMNHLIKEFKIIPSLIQPSINNTIVDTLADIPKESIDVSKLSLNLSTQMLGNSNVDVRKLLNEGKLKITYPDSKIETYQITPTILKVLVGNENYIKDIPNIQTSEASILNDIYSRSEAFNEKGLKASYKQKAIKRLLSGNIVEGVGGYSPSESPSKSKRRSKSQPRSSSRSKSQPRSSSRSQAHDEVDLFGTPQQQTKKGSGRVQTKTGQFGDCMIDLGELKTNHRLCAYHTGTGKKVINKKCDSDTVDIITKKFNTRKLYSPLSKKLFSELVTKSNVDGQNLGQKVMLMNNLGGETRVYSNVDELLSRLENLLGSISAGNSSKNVRNESMNILDNLFKNRHINKKEHTAIFKRYLI